MRKAKTVAGAFGISKLAILRAADASNTPPSPELCANVSGDPGVAPALVRHSLAVHTWVAARSKFPAFCVAINSAKAKPSTPNRSRQSSRDRAATPSASQATCAGPATAMRRPPQYDADSCSGFPSGRRIPVCVRRPGSTTTDAFHSGISSTTRRSRYGPSSGAAKPATSTSRMRRNCKPRHCSTTWPSASAMSTS